MSIDCSKLLSNFDSWKASMSSDISAYQAKASTTKKEDDEMLLKEKEIADASLCISDEINKLTGTSSDIAALHEKILAKTVELENGETDISIAKDRVAYIRNPERKTSNYESWFPIDRPLHPASIVILIALSIFLGVFFLLSVLSAADIQLMFYVPATASRSSFMIWLQEQMTFSFWVVLIILISVVIYFVKRN